jgi:hypothetical protein
MWWRRGVYRVLVGNPEGKRPLGRPKRRWENNIKLDLKEMVCGRYGLDRASSGWGRWRALLKAAMSLLVP